MRQFEFELNLIAPDGKVFLNLKSDNESHMFDFSVYELKS